MNAASISKCFRQVRPEVEALEDRRLMSVFGTTDWSKVTASQSGNYPYSAAVSIYNRNADGSVGYKIGSGAMIGPNVVLTAAHVIYDDAAHKLTSNLVVVPGQAGDYKPYGAAAATQVMAVNGYTQNKEDRYDIGVIYLDRNIGNYTNMFGLGKRSEAFFDNQAFVNILQYPAVSLDGRQLTHAGGNVSFGTPDFIRYNGTLDTEPGSSGSPVYVIENGQRYIVGVHHKGGPDYNQAVRLDDFWFNRVISWRDNAPKATDLPDLMNRDTWFNVHDSTLSVRGEEIQTTANIWNGGTATARNFKVDFYASTNDIISSSDVYLGSANVDSLSAFQTMKLTWGGFLPKNIAAGKYYIGWMIDAGNGVKEYLDNNNTGVAYGTLTVNAPTPRDTSGARVVGGHLSAGTGVFTLDFNETINTSSFSRADIVRFTSPTGADLSSQITSVSASSNSITINFKPQTTPGTYQMIIGPNILDLAGNPMNQDGDGINGEATQDQYVAAVALPASRNVRFESAPGALNLGYSPVTGPEVTVESTKAMVPAPATSVPAARSAHDAVFAGSSRSGISPSWDGMKPLFDDLLQAHMPLFWTEAQNRMWD